jgi:predicted dehydrogenase
MAPIRVGIIGLGPQGGTMTPGAWAVNAHLHSLQALPEYEIVAVSNSSVESAQRSIDKHGLPASTKAYGNPEDIAKDPNVDLVVVSVNVAKHFSLAKPALENKKDVFVEWPLGATVAEAEELTRLAASNGVRTVVGLQSRAEPLVLKVKELIASGKIGQVVSSTVTASSALLPTDMWMKGAEYYLDFKSVSNFPDLLVTSRGCLTGPICLLILYPPERSSRGSWILASLTGTNKLLTLVVPGWQ